MYKLLQFIFYDNDPQKSNSNMDKITLLPIELLKEIEIYLLIEEIRTLRCTCTIFYNFITSFSININGLHFFDISTLRKTKHSYIIPSINNNERLNAFDGLFINELVIDSLHLPSDKDATINIIASTIKRLTIKKISLSPFNKNKIILPNHVKHLIIPTLITITNYKGYTEVRKIDHENFINLIDYHISKVTTEYKYIKCNYSFFHRLTLNHPYYKKITYLHYHLTKK